MANSQVGNKIKALGPIILLCSFSLLIKGMTNDKVFPEPVLEHATTSLPSNNKGNTFL